MAEPVWKPEVSPVPWSAETTRLATCCGALSIGCAPWFDGLYVFEVPRFSQPSRDVSMHERTRAGRAPR